MTLGGPYDTLKPFKVQELSANRAGLGIYVDFPDQQIHSGEAEEQYCAFKQYRAMMELVEFDAAEIGFGSVLHRDHVLLESFHAAADSELGGGGQQHHKHDAHGYGAGHTGKVLGANQACYDE